MDYILVMVLLVLFVSSLLMLSGKGTFLLHGSSSDSDRFDTKKLSKITGCMMLFITALIVLQIVFEDQIPSWVFIAGVLISVLGVLVAQYTICRKKDFISTSKQDRDIKPNKLKIVISIIGSIVVIGFFVFIMFTGSIDINLQKTSVTFGATMTTPKTIDYKDIEKLQIKDELQSSRRVGGISNSKIDAGNYKNDEYGKYRRYTNANSNSYIIIIMKDDSIIVVNDKTEKETKKLYDELVALIP